MPATGFLSQYRFQRRRADRKIASGTVHSIRQTVAAPLVPIPTDRFPPEFGWLPREAWGGSHVTLAIR